MSSHIRQSCVTVEAILSDGNKKYSDKVNALLAAWEHVANDISRAKHQPQQQQRQQSTPESLVEWANEHTLKLVLRGEWPKLAPAYATHLNVTLERCARELTQQRLLSAARRCHALVDLVKNPWGKPALEKIIHGQVDDEEEEFCCEEKGELLTMRLHILCEDRCEDIAMNLAAACVRSLRRSNRLHELSQPGQVQYITDVYVVLLCKRKRTQDIVAHLKHMEIKDALEMMQRLGGERPLMFGTSRVWQRAAKAAHFVAHYLVAMGMARPLAELGPDVLEQILNSWARLHKDAAEASLPSVIRKLIEPAESAHHIYIFCQVLVKNFDVALKPLVIELYIRALTTDLNELERQKSNSNKEKVQETVQRLSREFLNLADYVNDVEGISRECVLTAFSLHPTRACYDRIRQMAIACGKITPKAESSDGSIKVEIVDKTEEDDMEPKTERPTRDLNEIEIESIERIVGASLNKQPSDSQADATQKSSAEETTTATTAEAACANHEKNVTEAESPASAEKKSDALPEARSNEEASKTSSVDDKSETPVLEKGDATTGSATGDEKAVPSQVRDREKLGISQELSDDLAGLLSSQRYHLINWLLEWPELSELCERYLENAEEMRNSNKELKYLNIDYSQFKDKPYDDGSHDPYYGIEKGYEQWDDSDFSESEIYQQSNVDKTTTTAQRSLESSDSDSENLLHKSGTKGRPKKVPRLDSSESELERKNRKPRQRFRKVLISSSESENTQDSQTSSLGSDGCKKNSKKIVKKTCNGAKKVIKRRPKKTKAMIDPFHFFVNENLRPDVIGVSTSDMMTLFSADENKHETLTGSAAFNAAQIARTIKKQSDPEVIKTLRMFRKNHKKASQISQKSVNGVSNPKRKEYNNADENSANNAMPKKYAPMLSTINLSPKIALRRVDEINKHLLSPNKKVSALDLNNELRQIQKTLPFSPSKNSLSAFPKQKPRPRKKSSKSNLQELLTVPGVHSMEFSVVPRVQPTVHVVQLSRNIPQSPNSTASGNTPPRSRSNIQLPGTPSSGGHDSGVGMSPAGQTPPPPTRSSSLQDVGEEANQPPDNSPGLADSTNTSTMDSTDSTRTVALTVLANQRVGSNQSPKKSPSPSTNNAQEQHVVLCKPDGTWHHLVSPNAVIGQRGILSLQNFDDGNISFARQVPVASGVGAEAKTTQAQTTRNAGLPKFQQAFGKTICTLSTESTTVPSTSSADTRAPAGAATNVQRANAKSTNAANMSKSIQTSVPNASIVSIPSFQQGGTRQVVNIVQSANSNATTASGSTLQLVQNSAPGNVIYSIPSSAKISGKNATQLISIPASLANSRPPMQVKLNIIRTNYAGQPIQAVVHHHRIQQPAQQTPANQAQQPPQQQQQQAGRSSDPMINNSTMESTLEQLREFESVLEQVKERSTGQSSTAETATSQTQTQTVQSGTAVKQTQQVPVGTLTQQLLMSSQSPSNAVEFPSNGNTLTFQQQEVYPQKVALMYTNKSSGSSTPSSTPVVVVTSYCQPAASPALSVTSQSSSSPCVTPAPTPVSSTGKTPPQSSKSSKKAAPKSVKQVSAQTAAKQTPIPKPQQKPQEDPETTQRIYAILGQYAEQLRNSPDLNNKPAPRRRSNPPTNPNQSSKRKKSGSGKSKGTSGQQTSEPSPSAEDMNRTMGSSEDSSGGGGGAGSISGNGSSLMHVQDSPAGYSASEETMASSNNNSQSGNNDNATLGNSTETKPTIVTSDSNDSLEGNVKRRNLIFTEPNTGQARAVIVQEAPNVGEALASVAGGKVTTGTAVLVSGTNFMLPMNFVKSGQQITVVSGGSKFLAAVPAVRTTGNASGVSNAFVLQSLLSQANKVIQQQQSQPKLKLAHQSQIVIPQTGGVVRFANDDSGSDKSDGKPESSKPPTTTIGLFQHSGVITTNPTIGQRIINSSAVKLPAVKAENAQKVVCLATPTTTKEAADAQKTTATIALAFTPSANVVSATNVTAQAIKEAKKPEATPETETLAAAATTAAKGIKSKDEHAADNFQCNATADSLQPLNKKIKQQSSQTPATTSTTITSSLDNSSQFLVSGGPSSDSQESASSTIPSSAIESSSMDGTKVENGVLCGNARLQEAWEPERKGSPDTPWRYTPASNALGMEPLKVYSRDGESSETVHNSVLQTINKGQGIELSSSGIFQTKKFFPSMNNAKSLIKSGQTSNARAAAEQENQQRKQQALEHQLRLQKSLSEECEDLGVDEPSTSDLFPEADLLFDTNHSPAFDNSSQEASCSHTLSGSINPSSSKSYAGASATSFFKSIDSASSGSRDASPVVTAKNAGTATKKKAPVQRRATKPKETPAKKIKRSSDGLLHADSGAPQAKHIRLSLVENLSQDETSNSNSDASRLSPAVGNESSKETEKPKAVRKNTKATDNSSHEVLDTTTESDIGQHSMNTLNNASSIASSEEDESLNLLEDSAANVTIPSPVSSVAGPLLTTNRYTYSNNKKRSTANAPATVKTQRTSDFFSTESPISERTRSSTDNDEDEEDDESQEDDASSSVSESFGPTEISGIGNGLQEIIRNVPTVKVTPVDHATYSAKRKAPIARKTTVNHKDSAGASITLNKSSDAKASTAINPNAASKKAKVVAATSTLTVMSENESSSPVPSADKIYDIGPSDDEASSTTVLSGSTLDAGIEHCSTAAGRRSSLRGHVKKNCACCNGVSEKPKAKKVGPPKPQPSDPASAKLKKPKQQQPAKPLAKKR